MPTITVSLDYEVQAGTLWGACPAPPGGESASAATTVPAKWGGTPTIRQFMGSSLTWPSVPAGCVMQRSYKMAGVSVTDAQIDAFLTTAANHMVTINHESDNDGQTSTGSTTWLGGPSDVSGISLSGRIALMNRFYDRNVALGKPCLIVPTFTGGFWSSSTADSIRDLWMPTLKGDLIGVDYDGVHDDRTTKPADLVYRKGSNVITNADEIANIQRYLTTYAHNGWSGFTVPEFGISRASWDTDGQGRTKWLQDNGARFVAAGAYAVHWYDFSVGTISDVIDPGTPEHTALRNLIAGN